MRELTTHLADDEPAQLRVVAADESGVGSPCHRYVFSGFVSDASLPQNDGTVIDGNGDAATTVLFQKGPIDPATGPNGVTVQSLLDAVRDNLRGGMSQTALAALPPEVLDNLRKAVECLDRRDARLQQKPPVGNHLRSMGMPVFH